VLAALLLSTAILAPAAAQEATPVTGEELGLQEIRIRTTDTAFEGAPSELPAGRYLVTLEHAGTGFGATVEFMMLPEGMTAEDFASLFAPPTGTPDTETPPEVEATPPEVEATPGPEGPPAWYYQTTMAGGVGIGPGQTGQVVIDLSPGNWVIWSGDPAAPQAPVGLTVTGEIASPVAMTEPPATVTITEFEYGFRMEGTLQPGVQWLKVVNSGAQPHFTFIFRSTVPVTREQIQQLLELEAQGATPAPDSGLPNPNEDFIPVVFTGTQSTGTTQWVRANIEPGTYILVCFVPDIQDGSPHAYHGMFEVVEVADGVTGSPVATPTG
jgi:hypothetical protein